MNTFDLSDPRAPVHLDAVRRAAGAHHIASSPDGRLACVQNRLIYVEGINDGSTTLVNLENLEAVGSIDTFKAAGFTVIMTEGMPEDPLAHTH